MSIIGQPLLFSGGAGSSITVIGSSTRPSGAPDNTIWVKTSRDISSWILNEDEPAAVSNNRVWIKTTKYYGIETNIAGDNKGTIYVRPTAALQYYNNTWNYLEEAYIYQNGEWHNLQRIPTMDLIADWSFDMPDDTTSLFHNTVDDTNLTISTANQASRYEIIQGAVPGNGLHFAAGQNIYTAYYVASDFVEKVGPITYSMWIRSIYNNTLDRDRYFYNSLGANRSYGFRIGRTKNNYITFIGGKNTTDLNFTVTGDSDAPFDGNWHHLVCLWDGTESDDGVRIYIDNVVYAYGKAADGDARSDKAASKSIINAGGGNTNNYPPMVDYDQIRIYNRALSDEEITNLYNERTT